MVLVSPLIPLFITIGVFLLYNLTARKRNKTGDAKGCYFLLVVWFMWFVSSGIIGTIQAIPEPLPENVIVSPSPQEIFTWHVMWLLIPQAIVLAYMIIDTRQYYLK